MEISAKIPRLADKIRDGHKATSFIAYYLEYLIFHSKPSHVEPSFSWLLKNGMTGQKFVDFIKVDCRESGLEMIRYITMRLEKEKKLRRLTAGDMRV